MVEKTDVMVLKDYFGLKKGQTSGDFLKELRDLELPERKLIADGIRDGSLTYVNPTE